MAHTQGKLFCSPDYKQIHADNGEKETWKRNTICDIRGDYENRKADAERIATTWNEHDQLKAELASLKEAREGYESVTSKAITKLKEELEASKEREGKLREALINVLSVDIGETSKFVIGELSHTEIKEAKELLNQ